MVNAVGADADVAARNVAVRPLLLEADDAFLGLCRRGAACVHGTRGSRIRLQELGDVTARGRELRDGLEEPRPTSHPSASPTKTAKTTFDILNFAPTSTVRRKTVRTC